MRTENDLRAAMMTLEPDPAAGALMDGIRRRIARRRTARRASLAVVAAGVAAILIVTSVQPGPRQHSRAAGRSSARAAVALRTLAMVAAAQPAVKPAGPGQFFYYATEGSAPTCLKPISGSTGYSYFQNCYIRVNYLERAQTWIASNGSGRVRNTTIRATFPSRLDRAHWIAAGRPALNQSSNLTFGPHKLYFGPPDLWTLPTNPARLAALLYARKIEGGPPGPSEDFTQVGDLLRYLNAPPALRSAAFQVGARIPGVKALGTVSFRGITGLGIAYVYQPKQGKYAGVHDESELIFDPVTSAQAAPGTRWPPGRKAGSGSGCHLASTG